MVILLVVVVAGIRPRKDAVSAWAGPDLVGVRVGALMPISIGVWVSVMKSPGGLPVTRCEHTQCRNSSALWVLAFGTAYAGRLVEDGVGVVIRPFGMVAFKGGW